jgi:glutathione peroxidase
MTSAWRAGLAFFGLLSLTPLSAGATTAWDFSFVGIDGQPLPLGDFRGKALLVVNTASECGFTPQYKGLEELSEKYKERGLVVLGVPSNDFGGQEPGNSGEIKQFCELNYDIQFPLTEKTKVVGDGAHPFYQWAAKELGPLAKPRWNFHKYLIAPDGRLVDWFSTVTTPDSKRVIKAIESVLPN